MSNFMLNSSVLKLRKLKGQSILPTDAYRLDPLQAFSCVWFYLHKVTLTHFTQHCLTFLLFHKCHILAPVL